MTTPAPNDDLAARIATAAAEPAKASVDGQSAENRSLREMIEADRHLANRRAGRAPRFGIGLSRIVPGSALGGGQ
jgi:hypothetical protein